MTTIAVPRSPLAWAAQARAAQAYVVAVVAAGTLVADAALPYEHIRVAQGSASARSASA